MPRLPQAFVDAIARLFSRIGKQLKNMEFVGDNIAGDVLKFGTHTVPTLLIGYAIGSDGKKHKILNDPRTGKHYIVDGGQVHEVL